MGLRPRAHARTPARTRSNRALRRPPRRLVAPHLERLLQSKGTSVAEYLGRTLHRRFVLGAATSSGALGSLLEQYEADLDGEDRQLLRAMHG